MQHIKTNNRYKDVAYGNHIKFHKKLQSKIPTKTLKLQALAYIDIFNKIFNKNKTDYLICIGDSRLSIEVAIAVAKQKGIKIYYIEQGPFGTTFFDDKGVNTNLSIRKTLDINDEKNRQIKLKSNPKKYSRSPIYRGLDILFMTLFERTTLYPPDLRFTDLNPYKSKQKQNKISHFNDKKFQVLLILQVPFDVNMIYHSPHFKSHLELVKNIYSGLKKDLQLVIREHPLYTNKYKPELYRFIAKNNILIDNSTPLNIAIDKAKYVIVNNSTVGVEAIFKYKAVVVLGNAFYDNDKICLKLRAKEELKLILDKAIDYTPDKNEIDNFKQLLFATVLLEGAITDRDLKSSKEIAKHLVTNH